MKQPIKIIRGTTNTFVLTIFDDSGEPYIMSNNEILRFGVKRHPGEKVYEFTKEYTGNGVQYEYTIRISPSDTKLMQYGKYYYDIGVQSGDDYYIVIECSDFDVCYNITGVEV